MTSRKIEHRTALVVLADSELNPSQRTLLEIPVRDPEYPRMPYRLSAEAIRLVGGVMADDVARIMAEEQAQKTSALDDLSREQRHLAHLADKLMQWDPAKDVYEGYDRAQVSITDTCSVTVTVTDAFDGYRGEPDYAGRRPFFTPEGMVYDPLGDFRQKLVVVSMENENVLAESRRFNLGGAGRFSLYTNNLVVQPPRWEYLDGDFFVSDMLPGTHPGRPYDMHRQPPLLPSEELAQGVVGKLAEIIVGSSR